jgi:histidinol dehydrogenase
MIAVHRRGEESYEAALEALAVRGEGDLSRVEPVVREILQAVQGRGDEAIRDCARRFEGREVGPILLPEEEWRARARETPPALYAALEEAAARIRRYHERQKEEGFRYTEEGIELGQRILPVRAAGLYAPGGKARYPSTVLMTAIPAAVAGVPRLVLCSPDPPPEVLAAAAISGVTEVVDAGGAQGIAALAYGTESVTRVDTIVGPGNLYVTAAKRLVFGLVNIDGIAGPSEILVVADEGADPEVVAADLLSQAEHDQDAYALLVTLEEAYAERVIAALQRQLAALPRREVAEASLRERGACFVVGDLEEAARVADRLAAEHLSLSVADPDALIPKIRAAGAIFCGYHTPEAAGDYAAGPSHVLPTGGAARFGSPLGVYNFVVRSSLIRYDEAALRAQRGLLTTLARQEGLEAHARAVTARVGEPVGEEGP